jgi:hypothetical protein
MEWAEFRELRVVLFPLFAPCPRFPVKASRADNYALRSFIHRIVDSRQFLNK